MLVGHNADGSLRVGISPLTIGASVAGGGANRIIYADSSQSVASSATLTYDGTTLTVGALPSTAGTVETNDDGNLLLSPGVGGTATVINGEILYKRQVEAKTSAMVVTTAVSGKVFTNKGATTQVNFTLPSAAVGLQYTFIVQDSDGVRVTAASGDTIRIAGSVTAAAGHIDNSTIGGVVTLLAVDATEWFAISYVGTWALT